MKKWITILIVVLLCAAILLSLSGQRQTYRISDSNAENFSLLLSALLAAYEAPSGTDIADIEADLAAIRSVKQEDYTVARSVTDHWFRVYLDPEYRLNLHLGGDLAVELADSGIRNSVSHAFVILGYELKDGEMTDELKGRCNAAAAAARSFPEAILICSGGATGSNNPERHTEAALMKGYLTDVCRIDEGRIYTDERAMTTAENAVNSFSIMREQGVTSMTIVTSSYHQRWGQVLYNGLAAMYAQQYGWAPVIVSNYCYETEPENGMFRNDARIALSQLGSILGLSQSSFSSGPRQK